jgi:hypothetical protein
MKLKLYGYSDDLIVIDGAKSDEHDCLGHEKPINISASDGTKSTIFYNDMGEWEIKVKNQGGSLLNKIERVGENHIHTNDASGCPGYSDVLIFNDSINWIKIGRKNYNTK